MNMEELSEKTGLSWDGGKDDNRLFADGGFLCDDNEIRVYAPTMGIERYAEMEKDLNDFDIKREKYTVYACNDMSGFDYWNKEDETNYIQITANIDDSDLSPEELTQLVDDVWECFYHFEEYDNIEDYIEWLREHDK